MADEAAQQTEAQRKAEIIAKQMAEADRIMNSEMPPSKNVHPMYGKNGLGLMGFVCSVILGLIAPLVAVFLLANSAPGLLFPFILIYSVGILIVAVGCYLKLKASDFPSEILIAVFAFALVSALEVWVSFGGILSAILAYIILSHYGWVEM